MLLTCIEMMPSRCFQYVFTTEEDPPLVARLQFPTPLDGACIGRWYGISPKDIGPPVATSILRQIQGEVDA